MTDTTPTPNELLTRIAEASRAGRVEELRSIVSELPVPPNSGPRLVLISLDSPGPIRTSDMWPHVNRLEGKGQGHELGSLLARIDDAPDVMAVIDQVVRDWWGAPAPTSQTAHDHLMQCIRAALEGATQ